MLQMLFSAISITDANDAFEYVGKVHRNLKLSDKMTVDEFIDVIPGGKENSALQRLSESHLFIASKQKFTILICGQPDFSNV